MKITIGITDCGEKHPIYEAWTVCQNDNIEIIKLGYKQDNLNKISLCDGIIMTGGEDIYPDFYNINISRIAVDHR